MERVIEYSCTQLLALPTRILDSPATSIACITSSFPPIIPYTNPLVLTQNSFCMAPYPDRITGEIDSLYAIFILGQNIAFGETVTLHADLYLESLTNPLEFNVAASLQHTVTGPATNGTQYKVNLTGIGVPIEFQRTYLMTTSISDYVGTITPILRYYYLGGLTIK